MKRVGEGAVWDNGIAKEELVTDTLPKWIDPRSVTVERRWLPLPGHEHRLVVLERELAARGTSWQVVAALSSWLRWRVEGRPDPTNGETRRRYRKLLAELADVDPDDPGEGLGADEGDHPGAGGPPVLVVDDAERALRVLQDAGIGVRVAAGRVSIIGGLAEAA